MEKEKRRSREIKRGREREREHLCVLAKPGPGQSQEASIPSTPTWTAGSHTILRSPTAYPNILVANQKQTARTANSTLIGNIGSAASSGLTHCATRLAPVIF